MPQPPENPEAEEWAEVGTYHTLDEAHDHSLVPLSMGECVRVEAGEGPRNFSLLVETAAANRIAKELEEYAIEIRQHETPEVSPSSWSKHPAGVFYTLIWAATLLLVFKKQTQDPTIAERFATSSIGLMENGEWWRSFTALFLHGDGPHIFGNIVSGAVFGTLVSKSLGPFKGWLLILLSGTLGNLLTSWLTYPERFASLGASTAVFGALGILSGTGMIENFRENVRMPWFRILLPLFAGFILLGWLGGAAPDTGVDVLGHVFGFVAGVGLGILASLMQKYQMEP